MSVSQENSGATAAFSAKDYKSDLKPIWCAGCGNYAILNSLAQALAALGIPTHEIAVISGIGCSSRLPGYMSTYGFNSIHGRALPIATGVKLANPKTTVIVAGGDGDAFSIGGGHLPHAARRNVDLTYIVMDNRIYGMTKGQVSPTTPLESFTSTTQYGSLDPPVNMIRYMLAYGAGFVARGFAGDIKMLTSLVKQGIRHKGFAFIQALSPCVTYRGKEEYDRIKAMASDLPESHDPSNLGAAWEMSDDAQTIYMGVFYRNTESPIYEQRLEALRITAKRKGSRTIEELVDEFRP
jgi:2-oxoglutarate ferredoxin oxidoreductase subunit beta